MASWADTIATLEAEREHAETRRDRAEAVLEGGCRRQFGEPKIHGVDHYVSEFDYADGKRWGLERAFQLIRDLRPRCEDPVAECWRCTDRPER